MKTGRRVTHVRATIGLSLLAVRAMTAQTGSSIEQVRHLKDFPVVEFRRYTIKDGERKHFAEYFESYFPESFEQLGAIAFGQFLERDDASHFTWLRGFHSIEDRAAVNGAFYDGPLWKEHRSTMNDILLDSDNVLLLRALPEHGIPVLPAVDPVREEKGARGVVVAQIFPVKAGFADAFAKRAEVEFAAYRAAGVREAGVLVTLDVPNNFPRLPIRTDGPFLVWLGVLEGDSALEQVFRPAANRSAQTLSSMGMLRDEPELVVLAPTRRSRLRWWP